MTPAAIFLGMAALQQHIEDFRAEEAKRAEQLHVMAVEIRILTLDLAAYLTAHDPVAALELSLSSIQRDQQAKILRFNKNNAG